ncbi:hypothetical protein AB0Y04_00355 [Loigolactobacillus coryniformis]|uniref:hypothetical protein n=1 Tax=Loigolactobacillus coryniformis TaxID=1610 RepID=UPI003F272B37
MSYSIPEMKFIEYCFIRLGLQNHPKYRSSTGKTLRPKFFKVLPNGDLVMATTLGEEITPIPERLLSLYSQTTNIRSDKNNAVVEVLKTIDYLVTENVNYNGSLIDPIHDHNHSILNDPANFGHDVLDEKRYKIINEN